MSNISSKTVLTIPDLRSAIQILVTGDHGIVGADTETTGLKWYNSEVFAHCLACHKDRKFHAFYIPVRHKTGGNIDNVETAENMIEDLIYNNEKFKKIWFNMKFDLNMLKNHGIEVVNSEDAMIMMFLRNENEPNHRLKSLTSRYIFKDALEEDKKIKAYVKSNGITDYSNIPIEVIEKYGAHDAAYDIALWGKYSVGMLPDKASSIVKDGLRSSIYEHEKKFTFLVAQMERTGFPFDKSVCEELAPPIKKAIERLESDIWEIALDKNPDMPCYKLTSDVQVAKFMTDLGFRPRSFSKRTGKASWGKEQLMELGEPIGQYLACYRNLTHNLATFIEGLPKYEHNGRIYCSYNQIGARTGRASASEPNMQGIPTRIPKYDAVPEYANEALNIAFGVRRAFKAPLGFRVLKLDQSQFELRLLDHFAQDEHMHRAFIEGRDIHSETACRLWNFKYEEFLADVTAGKLEAKQFRAAAKECNFAVVYGAGPKRLKKTLDQYGYSFQLNEVRLFYSRYFEIFPGVRSAVNRIQGTVRRRGYIFNYYGRHKRVPANKAYVGVNYLIQGVTADMLKDAMIRMDEILGPGSKSELVLAVHDEVDVLLHDEDEHLIPKLVREMEDFPWCRTPIVCDVEIGPSWGELKPWSKE